MKSYWCFFLSNLVCYEAGESEWGSPTMMTMTWWMQLDEQGDHTPLPAEFWSEELRGSGVIMALLLERIITVGRVSLDAQ